MKQGYKAVGLTKIKTKHLTFEGLVNEKKANFILDTGSSVTVLDLNKAVKFKCKEGTQLQQEASGIGESLGRYELKNVKIDVDGQVLKSENISLLDLSPVNQSIQSVCGKEVDVVGILGADILWKYKSKIDYFTKEITFTFKNNQLTAPIDILITGHLLIHTQINEKPASLIVDTGASDTVVDLNKKDFYGFTDVKLLEEDANGLGQGAIHLFNGDHSFSLNEMNLDLSKLLMIDLSHINDSINKLYKKKKRIDGVFGADFLNKYQAVIDYQTKELYLKS